MHEGADLSWREVVEKHHTALTEEISVRLDAQLQRAVLHAVESERSSAREIIDRTRIETAEVTRRSISESLNQAIRRLKTVTTEAAVLNLLTESASAYCARSTIVQLQGFDLEAAPAIAAAAETGDPVTAFASSGELSAGVADALGSQPGEKAYLFPVIRRQNVTAMLVATGDVAATLVELLCEAAGMRLDGLSAEAPPALTPLPNPAFVQIGPVSEAAAPSAERRAWDQLSADERQLHLKAQRAARVRVAEVRLHHAGELSKGVAASDIYAALRTQIDSARSEFLQTFLTKSSTMVDYLHLEILRSLAHDDDRLLGEKYPGPMV